MVVVLVTDAPAARVPGVALPTRVPVVGFVVRAVWRYTRTVLESADAVPSFLTVVLMVMVLLACVVVGEAVIGVMAKVGWSVMVAPGARARTRLSMASRLDALLL